MADKQHAVAKSYGEVHVLDDIDGFVSNVVKVLVAFHGQHGTLVEYPRPEVSDKALGHPYKKATTKTAKQGIGGCTFHHVDPVAYCNAFEHEHTAVTGWVMQQKQLAPAEKLPDGAGIPIPRTRARQIGEALIAFADAAEGKPAAAPAATDAALMQGYLERESARVDSLIGALVAIVSKDEPVGDLFPAGSAEG